MKQSSKKKTAGAMGLLLSIAAVVGCATGVAALVKANKAEKTKTIGVTAYTVGILSDENGKVVAKDKSGLYTKEYYKFNDKLEIELDKDADVFYQLNYYTKEKTWLGVQTFEEDFDMEDVEVTGDGEVAYVRIEIIPTNDDDDEVGTFEKFGYVGQVSVTVSK